MVAAAKRAQLDVRSRANTHNKLIDKLWAVAAKAPMNCKTTTNANGRVVKRSARLVNAHGYNIVAAGAARAVIKQQQAEADALGIPFETTTSTTNCLPSFSNGAKFMLEKWLESYVKEGIYRARSVMLEVGRHKRLTRDVVKLGFDEANSQIFVSSNPAPTSTIILALQKKKKKKVKVATEAVEEKEEEEGDGDDYTPPDEAEADEEEEEAEAEAGEDDDEEDAEDAE